MHQVTTPVVEKIEMGERTMEIRFFCTLAGIPAYISGTYFVNTNSFYPNEISGDTLENVCRQFNWDESETQLAIQNVFESR